MEVGGPKQRFIRAAMRHLEKPSSRALGLTNTHAVYIFLLSPRNINLEIALESKNVCPSESATFSVWYTTFVIYRLSPDFPPQNYMLYP